jgi:hypothetical protein
LAAWTPSDVRNAPVEIRDRLASVWNDDDGWQIGYLVLFEGEREGGATIWGDPDFDRPAYRHEAQLANQNAQTIALAKPLTARSLPEDIRKRNQQRVIVALYRQQTDFPDDETHLMGPLESLPALSAYDAKGLRAEGRLLPDKSDPFSAEELRDAEVDAWWARQTIVEAQQYAVDYPTDPFAATALLAACEVSGRTALLRQIIANYPDGPRTEEARALLWRATTKR